jgi:hypothetical protein
MSTLMATYGKTHPRTHKVRWVIKPECGDDVCATCGFHRTYAKCFCDGKPPRLGALRARGRLLTRAEVAREAAAIVKRAGGRTRGPPGTQPR